MATAGLSYERPVDPANPFALRDTDAVASGYQALQGGLADMTMGLQQAQAPAIAPSPQLPVEEMPEDVTARPPSVAYSPSLKQFFVQGRLLTADDAAGMLESEATLDQPGTGLPAGDWIPLEANAYRQKLAQIRDPGFTEMMGKGWDVGVQQLKQLTGGALQAFSGDKIGGGMRAEAEAQLAKLAPYQRDVAEGITADWFATTIGQFGPMFVESVASALAGAAVGTATGGPAAGFIAGVSGLLLKPVVKKNILAAAGRYNAAKAAGTALAKNSPDMQLLRKVGAIAGATAGSLASGYKAGVGDIYTEGGTALEAIVGGIPYAALDTVVDYQIVKRALRGGRPKLPAGTSLGARVGEYAKRAAAGVAVGGTAEGMAESAQEGIVMAAAADAGDGYDSAEVFNRFLNSFAAGFAVGGLLGGTANLRTKPDEETNLLDNPPKEDTRTGQLPLFPELPERPGPFPREERRQPPPPATEVAPGQMDLFTEGVLDSTPDVLFTGPNDLVVPPTPTPVEEAQRFGYVPPPAERLAQMRQEEAARRAKTTEQEVAAEGEIQGMAANLASAPVPQEELGRLYQGIDSQEERDRLSQLVTPAPLQGAMNVGSPTSPVSVLEYALRMQPATMPEVPQIVPIPGAGAGSAQGDLFGTDTGYTPPPTGGTPPPPGGTPPPTGGPGGAAPKTARKRKPIVTPAPAKEAAPAPAPAPAPKGEKLKAGGRKPKKPAGPIVTPAPAKEAAPAPAPKGEGLKAGKRGTPADATTVATAAVSAKADEIRSKLYDLNTNLASKRTVVAYATKLRGEGVLSDADLAEVKRIAADRDMSTEDVVDAVSGSVESWYTGEVNRISKGASNAVQEPSTTPVPPRDEAEAGSAVGEGVSGRKRLTRTGRGEGKGEAKKAPEERPVSGRPASGGKTKAAPTVTPTEEAPPAKKPEAAKAASAEPVVAPTPVPPVVQEAPTSAEESRPTTEVVMITVTNGEGAVTEVNGVELIRKLDKRINDYEALMTCIGGKR